jgi:hypothetical protein
MKLFILSLCVLFCSSLFARDAASKKDHSCARDQKRFCQGIRKGKASLEKCLKKNKSELSKSCKEKIFGKKEKKKAKLNKKLSKKKNKSAYYKETPMVEIKEAKQEILPDAVQVILPDTNVIEPSKL